MWFSPLSLPVLVTTITARSRSHLQDWRTILHVPLLWSMPNFQRLGEHWSSCWILFSSTDVAVFLSGDCRAMTFLDTCKGGNVVVTCDNWHLTCDRQHVIHGGKWIFYQNFRSLVPTHIRENNYSILTVVPTKEKLEFCEKFRKQIIFVDILGNFWRIVDSRGIFGCLVDIFKGKFEIFWTFREIVDILWTF